MTELLTYSHFSVETTLVITASHFLKMWQYMPYASTNQQTQVIIYIIFGTRGFLSNP